MTLVGASRLATLDFGRDIHHLTGDFARRELVLAEIAWLADLDGPYFFSITGEPGIGTGVVAVDPSVGTGSEAGCAPMPR